MTFHKGDRVRHTSPYSGKVMIGTVIDVIEEGRRVWVRWDNPNWSRSSYPDEKTWREAHSSSKNLESIYRNGLQHLKKRHNL